MMLRPRMTGLSFLLILMAGCSADRLQNATVKSQELRVFAAASLTDAFSELAGAYEVKTEGVHILLNFAGSSQLAAQLIEGVEADVYSSANPAQIQALIAAGRIEPAEVVQFASNRLTVVVPLDNPAGITALEDLARPGVQLILAVEGVPIRAYTDDIVATMATDSQALFYSNVVSEEDNVRQVLAKIALGEAHAGITYASDVTPDVASRVNRISIPDNQNVVATYPMAPLADAPHPELAQDFTDFVLSSEGQRILSRWGFGPPPGS